MRKILTLLFIIFFLVINTNYVSSPEGKIKDKDWPKYARIATPYDLNLNASWEKKIERSVESGANVILDWSIISDGYSGLISYEDGIKELTERVKFIKRRYPSIKYIIYMAPLEVQTYNADENLDGKPDEGVHTVFTDHPDWIQVGFSGKKALFYGRDDSLPFWVEKTSEDAWLCPNNPEYRRFLKKIFTLLAQSGIDGIWLDVPFLKSDFGESFKDEWACTCNYCREKFEEEEGISFPEKVDWEDKSFKRFIEFRYRTTEDFIKFIKDTIKSVNPDIKLIVETPVTFTPFSTQNASDTLNYLDISDVTVHELDGPLRNSQIFSHLYFLSKMYFSSSTDKRASWILSYVFKRYKGFLDLYKFHGAEIGFLRMNPLTSQDETMSMVVNEDFRKILFNWLKKYKKEIFNFREIYSDVCVVFSRRTLDFIDRGSYMSEYAYHDMFPGMLMLLSYLGIPYTVIGERDIERIKDYKLAIFPSFLSISNKEKETIENYVRNGGKVIFTGYSSLFDEYGNRLSDFRLKKLFGVSINDIEDKVYERRFGNGKVIFIPWTPEGDLIYTVSPWDRDLDVDFEKIEDIKRDFVDDTDIYNLADFIKIETDGLVVPVVFRRGSVYSVRLINFTGISKSSSVPEKVNVKLKFKLRKGMEVERVTLIPYLGKKRDLSFEIEDGYLIINEPLLYLNIFNIYTLSR